MVGQPLSAASTRRQFLRNSALAGGVLLGGSTLLSACGSHQAGGPAAPTGKPKTGGTLQVGISGGGNADTLNYLRPSSRIDFARVTQLYEPLAWYDHDFKLQPWLGTEFIPDATGRSMTVKLRTDVLFHNGKKMTADDVVFSYRPILDPRSGAAAYALLGQFVTNVTAVDPSTVRFEFNRPFYDLQDFASGVNTGIVPVGYDENNPVGTGPFKFQSFNPGQQSVFVRNEHYWGTGPDGVQKPYVDSLIISDLNDDSARVNALISGAVHAIDTVPFNLVSMIKSTPRVDLLVSDTGNWYPITMRVDQPPFNDPRVRQAFRLIADRKQIIDGAFSGYSKLGNDLYSMQDPLFDHSIAQRTQDIDQAKSLLKQAGQSDLAVELVTAPIAGGVVQQSILFAKQAEAAGVKVKVTTLDPTTFFNSEYLNRTLSVDWWSTASFVVESQYATGPSAPYNDTHYSDPQFDQWFYQLVGTTDQSLRTELASNMQKQLWDNSGFIIPNNPQTVDAYSQLIAGFVPDYNFNLSNWGFKDIWFV